MPKKTKVTDRYDSILLEGIRGDIKAVAEVLVATRECLEVKIESVKTELKQDISDLHLGMTLMDQRLASRLDGVDSRLDKIENRLDCYGHDIGVLKKASCH